LGRYIVGPAELWVVSPYSPFSFDSRYFGPVLAALVRGSLRRL
jgi:type IV secretory pathway protease TraF